MNVRVIGLNFQKGRIRVAVLEHDPGGKIVVSSSRVITVDPEFMERYAAQLKIQNDEFSPDMIASRQVWDPGSAEAAMCQVAPFGIAAYVCNERGITFRYYTPQALKQPKPLGLLKGTNLMDAVSQAFGTHPPYWDDMQKGAVLAGWRALLET